MCVYRSGFLDVSEYLEGCHCISLKLSGFDGIGNNLILTRDANVT